MELWVRSSDKACLEQVKDLYVDSPNDRAWRISNETTVFGIYDTKERCLEILDEIQNEIQKASRDYIIWQSNEISALSESDMRELDNQLQKYGIVNVPKEVRAEFVPKGSQAIVYQMPEK